MSWASSCSIAHVSLFSRRCCLGGSTSALAIEESLSIFIQFGALYFLEQV
jgi:hypothetical protein